MDIGSLRREISTEQPQTIPMPDICPADIKINPAELIRYRENARFGRVVMQAFEQLMAMTMPVTVEDVHTCFDEMRDFLSAPQQMVMDRLRNEIINKLETTPLETKEDVIRGFDRLRTIDPSFPEILPEEITLLPLGMIGVTFDRLYLFDITSEAMVFRPHDPINVTPEDRETYGQLWRTIFVKKTTFEGRSSSAQLTKHEFFHLVNHAYLEPVTPIAYRHPLEQEVFRMVKDEVLAYLVEGRWEMHLKHHLNSDWYQEVDPDGNLDVWDVQLKAGHLILKKLSEAYGEKMPGDEEDVFGQKAKTFYLELFFLQRELARLRILSNDDLKLGIQAILAAQSFKEMGYNLSKIGQKTITVEDLFDTDYQARMLENIGYIPLDRLRSLINTARFFALPIEGFDTFIQNLRQATKEQIENAEPTDNISYYERVLALLTSYEAA